MQERERESRSERSVSTTQLGLLPTAIRSFSTHQKLLQALSRVFTRWFATLFFCAVTATHSFSQ